MKFKLAGFILFATCSAIAQTGDKMTMFGLEMGKPLDLPDCKYTGATKSVGIQQYTCFEPASEQSQNRPRVHFGLKEIPPIVKGLSMAVELFDDKLDAMRFATPGVESKEKILRFFTAKYGSPTTLTKANLQDADGASVETFTAIWDTPALYVEFKPAGGNLKEGFARIETQRAHQARVAAQNPAPASR